MLWHIGNTTVRTPYRLREALIALQESSLNGNISGRQQENAFATLLHNRGVLSAERVDQGEEASDLGRKWRAALSQLGFITPQLTKGVQSGAIDPQLVLMIKGIDVLSGRPFEITPNGYHLISSEIITSQQECFLRSLASYKIPSILESNYKCAAFSPLRFVLRVVDGLIGKGQDNILYFQEYALFVQTSTPEDGIDSIIDNIIEYRNGRRKSKGDVRTYDREIYKNIASNISRKEQTLDDYADLSFRYLKATGLFRGAGRDLSLSPARNRLAELLRQEEEFELSDSDYLKSLWLGAALPTDNTSSAYTVIGDLVSRLNARGVEMELPPMELSITELEHYRHELENNLLQLDEKEFADKQADSIEEIAAWMQAISLKGSVRLPNGDTVPIPKGEAPAYLEWAIWRAFLAINSLCNQPWEARRFQIDQDFLPVGTAPGRGPDMVFEFEDVVIVVEATLTSSSRQEAAEGEPVRRHVAQYVEKSSPIGGKTVYGLFIATQIDSNTAHTFRSGDWYLPNDTKLSLEIVPIALDDFRDFLVSGREKLNQMPKLLKQLIIECRAKANQDAPQWKKSIKSIVQYISSKRAGSNNS